jgi:hypothetical protein
MEPKIRPTFARHFLFTKQQITCNSNSQFLVSSGQFSFLFRSRQHGCYCGVAPRGRSIERPLLINGHAYLAVSLLINGYAYIAVSLLDNGQVDSNSYATEITDRCLGNRSTNRRPAGDSGTVNPLSRQRNS